MIKKLLPGIFLIAVALHSCKSKESKKESGTTDTTTTVVIKDSVPPIVQPTDSLIAAKNDSILLRLSTNVMRAIKAKDFNRLGNFIHPGHGLRFSPYGYVDTAQSMVLSKNDLLSLMKNQDAIVWGFQDGTGAPITLGIEKYFDRYVYDKDFLQAKEFAVNKYLGHGNSLKNIKDVYPDADFTEFYFPGEDPKYGGMDWRSLRLVFKKINNRHYLIAVVHDEWTI